MRKVDLTGLPKRGNSNQVDWKKSVGMTVPFVYDDIKGTIDIIEYVKQNRIKVEYNGIYKEMFTDILTRCMLGELIGKNIYGFIFNIGDNFQDDKRNITIIDKENRKDKYNNNALYYKYHCNVCGYSDGCMLQKHITKGVGCSCCAGKVVVEGINDIPTTAPWMVKYFQGGYDEAKQYTKSGATKINFICPDCGKIKEKSMRIAELYQKHSIGCTCGDGYSYPEKFMNCVLEQLKIKYKWQYSPLWLNGKLFDFLLSDYRMIIETDGYFHNDFDAQITDNWKDEQAKTHGLKVIRIDALESNIEYLKKNIIAKLAKYFILDNIDWELCDEQATKNIVKEVCKYYQSCKIKNTLNVATMFNISRKTVCLYLKKGSLLGWCDYNSQLARKQNGILSGSINAKKYSKKIEVYKDGVCLGAYTSCNELSRMSMKDFGIKLFSSAISKVATCKIKHHKGFIFKYV